MLVMHILIELEVFAIVLFLKAPLFLCCDAY